MFGFDYFGGYGWDDGGNGVNRRDWSDKSSAALTRENEAKQLVEDFLTRAKESGNNGSVTFPLTEEIVSPTIHLTKKSWSDFRKFVINTKGCTAKRREITEAEKKTLKPKSKIRKCAMYAISITIPVHPDELTRAKEEKKAKAATAKARKEDKAKENRDKARRKAEELRLQAMRDAEEQRRKAAEMKVMVETDYAKVVAFVDGKGKSSDQSAPDNTNTKKRALGDGISVEVNQNHPEGPAQQPSPTKKAKVTNATEDIVKLVAPKNGLVSEADRIYREKVDKIIFNMHVEEIQEKKILLEELSKKMEAKSEKAKKEAAEYRNNIKAAIEDLMSTPPAPVSIPNQTKESSASTKHNPGVVSEHIASTVKIAQNSTVQIVQIATPAAPSDQTKKVATHVKENPGPVDINVAIPTVNIAQ